MARINVSDLTFCYEGSFDNIFEKVSFSIDTDWKLGFIGRNGKGKTTFLNLLLGKYEYQGTISTPAAFEYFPYQISENQMKQCAGDFLDELRIDCELWRVICELEKLHLEADVLYRPFETLSHGERTKVLLAILFAGDNYFLLIDEPTNHLDQKSREIVKEYLGQKKGFILVSHDRDLLDACIDHVLVLNRHSIEVQNGNFSSWQMNKERLDHFQRDENEKHKREIRRLKKAADQARNWAVKNEETKIGYDPIKNHDRGIGTRAYIGAKTKKMQSRVKQLEERITKEISQKEGLLQDIENPAALKIMPLKHHKEVLIAAKGYGIAYRGASPKEEHTADCSTQNGIPQNNAYEIFHDFNLELRQGERLFLRGENGCGKSSFIKAILAQIQKTADTRQENKTLGFGIKDNVFSENQIEETGYLTVASGLIISYINQDTSFLKGNLKEFCAKRGLDESLLKAILRQLDLGREQFAKNMEEYSEGQKKKVLIASSLLTQAHLYLWDEPLNYIDVFSRMQIENLLLQQKPTMLVVEHDVRFCEKIATNIVQMGRK